MDEEHAKEIVNGIINAELVKFIKHCGLIDTYKKSLFGNYTVPTKLITDKKDSVMKVDYIFTSNNIKTIKSKIIKNSKTEYASDHYPICTTIDI